LPAATRSLPGAASDGEVTVARLSVKSPEYVFNKKGQEMKTDRPMNASTSPQTIRSTMRAAAGALALLAGFCSIFSTPAAAEVFPPDQPYMDNTAYAYGATDGLAASIVNEKAPPVSEISVMRWTISIGGRGSCALPGPNSSPRPQARISS